MGVVVKDNVISLTRGDSMILYVLAKKNDVECPLPEGTKVRFALNVEKDTRDNPLILKEIDPTTMLLRLNPEDTKDLQIGTYYYDVEYTTPEGFVDTFITPTKFKITSEVY